MGNIKQAVILAGGRGERLRPLTDTLPKPMAPVAGRPFLEHLIVRLRDGGIKRFLILLGYKADVVTAYFKDGSKWNVSIDYSITPVQDETGTRILKAASKLEDTFSLFYGDNFWPFDISAITQRYEEKKRPHLLTVYDNWDGQGEYGKENNVYIKDGFVLVYDRSRRDPRLNMIEIGPYILSKTVLADMPHDKNFSFEEVVLPSLVEKKVVTGFSIDHKYYSITDMEKLKKIERVLGSRKVILLDRDGVINKRAKEHEYITSWSEFEFLPGAIDALRRLCESGYELYVVTNQAGVARGVMSRQAVDDVNRKMKDCLRKEGVAIGGVYVCPHGYNDGCRCRKPAPGMLFQAAKEHDFDLTRAFFVGDSEADQAAGEATRTRTIIVSKKSGIAEALPMLL